MMNALLTAAPPAGGAPLEDAVAATAVGVVATGAILGLVAGHRSGRLPIVGRAADAAGKVTGLPGWAALPADLLGAALLVAVFGMYWDIAFHLDDGRDPGPLANPAHHLILYGLFGVFFAGVLACALPLRRAGATAVRLPNGWHAPVGGVLIAFFGAVALIAFPLDDAWHRAFGQDVTLWGPTHLLLIGGASFSTLALWMLDVEGTRARGGRPSALLKLGELAVAGSLLIGLSTFQAEFDFGLSQYRLVFHPALLMLAAGVALVAARVRLGRGAALFVVAFFLVIRGGVSLVIGPVLGHAELAFPLYAVEAIVVELVALRLSARGRPIAFGAVAGVAIGTAGLAAEWLWWDWPSSMLVEGSVLGLCCAVGGGLIGGFVGAALNGHGAPTTGAGEAASGVALRRRRREATALAGGALLVVGALAWAMPTPEPHPLPRATVTLRDGLADVRLDPPGAADDAQWFTLTAWQGGGTVFADLRRTGPGRWQTTKPVPLSGDWKTTLRLQRGRSLLALPVYLPADPAIPARAVRAEPRFTRTFASDTRVMQRERKQDVSGALTALGYAVVLLLWTAMLGALVWGLLRLARAAERPTVGPIAPTDGRSRRLGPRPRPPA